MTSTIKVNNIQNQCGANIANKCGSTITLGASGDTITLACGASQTGFGRTGTVNWDTTAKTASFTAVSGNGYFVNTTSGAITVTLPAGSAGDIVSLADYAATWQTNAVTVAPNGTDKIGSVNSSVTLNTEGQSVTFVYTDSTQGWLNTMDSTSNVRGNAYIIATGGTETTCGDYKIHTFTSPGTFCVSAIGVCASDNNVDYLVVAGGGGGGNCRGGGGGGGGLRFYSNPTGAPQPCAPALPINNFPSGTTITATATAYPITVGGGGAGGTTNPVAGANGSNSIFSTVTSAGGGGGSSDAVQNGTPGGSGGGGSNSGSGGTGNTPPVSPSQGQPGGPSAGGSSGSGGGGTICAGTTGPSASVGSVGGDGAGFGPTIFGSINGVPCGSFRYFAGGGGGGDVTAPKAGGKGGGGSGKGNVPNVAGDPGNAGTGGGGGGGSPSCGNGGNGGSGIVVIRYKYQ